MEFVSDGTSSIPTQNVPMTATSLQAVDAVLRLT